MNTSDGANPAGQGAAGGAGGRGGGGGGGARDCRAFGRFAAEDEPGRGGPARGLYNMNVCMYVIRGRKGGRVKVDCYVRGARVLVYVWMFVSNAVNALSMTGVERGVRAAGRGVQGGAAEDRGGQLN